MPPPTDEPDEPVERAELVDQSPVAEEDASLCDQVEGLGEQKQQEIVIRSRQLASPLQVISQSSPPRDFEQRVEPVLGIITDVNKQMGALTGCTRDELIGAPFKNYFTDPERAEAGIKLALSEKRSE